MLCSMSVDRLHFSPFRCILVLALLATGTSVTAVARAGGNSNDKTNANGNPPPTPQPPVVEPPLPSPFVYADPSRRDDYFVQRLGLDAPSTYHSTFSSVGFGVVYSLRVRGPYERQGVFGHPDDPREGFGAFPSGAVLGNELGIEFRLSESYRTHSGNGMTTTFAFAPVSIVRRKDWRITFPSLVGALAPEFGFVFVHAKDQGDSTHDEIYVRHQARFQILLGEDRITALDVTPFVQLSVPSDSNPARKYARFEVGLALGVSTDL